MKTLYLIRHAKSDWGHQHLADIDRPLNERGYNDAHTMSKRLKEKNNIPDAIVSSSAIRAISTALIFSRNLNFHSSKIFIQPALYHSSAETYIDVIAETDNKFNSLFLFAHNPTITNCANYLLKSNMEDIATTGIICITSDIDDWEEFQSSKCKLTFYDFPKNQ